ncbi:hypothetical protein Q5752_004870 [Cryptotrichosporon argae]
MDTIMDDDKDVLPSTHSSYDRTAVNSPLLLPWPRWAHVPGLARAAPLVRLVLGPSRPRRPAHPTSQLAFAYTAPGRSLASTPVNPRVLNISRKLRLHYALVPFLALWATGFVLLVREQYYLSSSPTLIDCDAALWDDWPPDTCGVNGTGCVSELEAGRYRCPGGCDAVDLGNPRWIGDESVNGVPLVIGGGDADHTYRADSWVCAAGVHARLVSPTFGGCVTVSPLAYPAGASNYTSKTGGAGLTSIPFLPSFPGAYMLGSTGLSRGCIEYHWIILAYHIACLFIFTALLSPPPGLLFSLLLVLGYFQVILVSDPPNTSPDWSSIIGGLPAVLFTGYWIYRVSFAYTLAGFIELPLDVAVFSGAGYWLGIESSTIFDRLPISTLGYGSLSAGGVVALVVIIALVVLVVGIQAWSMRKHGLLQYYFIRYFPLLPICLVLDNLGHGLVFRLHHYVMALAAFPIVSLPNRVSLFFQAFCLGLFLDGIGRWGWDSLVETASSLAGDSVTGSPVPTFLNASAATISWTPLNSSLADAGLTAFSLLVDDILWTANATSNSFAVQDAGLNPSLTHYLRIAYMDDGTSQDYSDPVTWANGGWQLSD